MEYVIVHEPLALIDRQLVDRLVNRDESAMSELYAQYRPLLAGVITKVTHNAAECEDVLQEVLVQVWNRIESYRESKGRLSSWLSTLAKRRAIDHVRKSGAYRRASDRFEAASHHDFLRSMNGRGKEMNLLDARHLIDRQLHLLPALQREAVTLSYLEGRSQREIAGLTKSALGTVKTRIELGLRKLSRAISDSRDKIF